MRARLKLQRCGPTPCDCPVEQRNAGRQSSMVAQLLALQRQAGNAAVTELIESSEGRRRLDREDRRQRREDREMRRERREGTTDPSVARPGANPVCSIPSGCPPTFCSPYTNKAAARIERDAAEPVLLSGIAAVVSPRVVPLWRQHLLGGAAPQNLSSTFGADFTASATTARATAFLGDALRDSLERDPPGFPPGQKTVTVGLNHRLAKPIAELGLPGGSKEMNFNVATEIPGNIAGGIGADETSHPFGAKPSPFNDSRTARGTAEVTQNADGTLTAVPTIAYTVKDTIDFCPGDCGGTDEQIATVPMSQFEASGISGDVPFTVEFENPPITITAKPPKPIPVPQLPPGLTRHHVP